jgi:hypothetical protein
MELLPGANVPKSGRKTYVGIRREDGSGQDEMVFAGVRSLCCSGRQAQALGY